MSASKSACRRSRLVASSRWRSYSLASSSVRKARSANSGGRSSGVMTAFDQMPCRSGCPCGVRGGVYCSPGNDWACRAGVAAASRATTQRRSFGRSAARPDKSPLAVGFAFRAFLLRLLAQMPIQHLLGERYALELKQLHIRFDSTVEGQADPPWAGEDLRIVYCRLVL